MIIRLATNLFTISICPFSKPRENGRQEFRARREIKGKTRSYKLIRCHPQVFTESRVQRVYHAFFARVLVAVELEHIAFSAMRSIPFQKDGSCYIVSLKEN